jgi:hypothetical protein
MSKGWERARNLKVTNRLELGSNAEMVVEATAGTRTVIDLAELTALDSIGAADLAKIDGITNGTGAAGKALVLDSNGDVTVPGIVDLDGNVLAAGEGSGITSGTGTVHSMFAQKQGELFITKIFVDLTGLASEATDDDIIGDGTAANSHIGQITAAVNGTIVAGTMLCLEAPATGEVDIDLYSAAEGTGAGGALITSLTETALLEVGADWTIDLFRALTGVPAADEYLYLTVGTASTPTAGTYTAGKFLIELYGTA